MSTTTLLKKLGYSETDRLVILHADDVGMCQATITAFADLWDCGGVSSGAVMTPCAWFPALAEYCRAHPDVDMGIHATLNCEYESYRWGALSTLDKQSGLLAADGYMHMRPATTTATTSKEIVSAELTAQISKAQAAGIQISHIDSHMGTIFSPDYVEDYLDQAIANRVPALMPRVTGVGFEDFGGSKALMKMLTPKLDQLDAQGYPLIDGIMMMPLRQPEGQLEIAKQMLSQIPVGITHFIYHPAVDTPELRAICSNDWSSRVANYETFMNPEIKQFIKDQGIHIIGYKKLRDIMRGN
ncbi:MAG: polysaccharide deacetylase family protein [Anaerolineaceae bacterium]|nr:polysaccharide deacetylase family protein [Anaerolineaceae bacterium]